MESRIAANGTTTVWQGSEVKSRRTVSPSARVVTTSPSCGADRQNLLHHTKHNRFAMGSAGLTAVPRQ